MRLPTGVVFQSGPVKQKLVVITFDTSPERYRHWALAIDVPTATLTVGVGSGAEPDSLLWADIELADALQRLRFEYPEVGAVVVRGGAHDAFCERIGEAIADAFVVSDVGDGPPAAGSAGRGPAEEAVVLGPLRREEFDGGFAYPNVRVEIDEVGGEAVLTIVGPTNHECFAPEPGPKRLRWRWWPLAVCREFDDALLLLRTNWPAVRRLVLRTEGDPLAVASADVALTSGYDHDWFVREVVLFWKRTLKRLDLASESVVALVEPGSCFVGTLLELALAADEIHMVGGPTGSDAPPVAIFLTGMNFGSLPQASGLTRLESRLRDPSAPLAELAQRVGDPIPAAEALELGLVTELGDHPGVSGTSR